MCVQWSHCTPSHSLSDTWPVSQSFPFPAEECSACPGFCTVMKNRPQFKCNSTCAPAQWDVNLCAEECVQTWKKISWVFFDICLTPESPSSPDTHTHGLTVAMAMLNFFMGMMTTRYGIPRETWDTQSNDLFILFSQYYEQCESNGILAVVQVCNASGLHLVNVL